MKIGEIAMSSARDSNFFSELRSMVEQQHRALSLACFDGAHHSGRTCSYDNDVFLELRQFNAILR
jgi:hypothetical protein